MFSLQVAMETVSYKLFVSGKAGVGKSSTVAKLTGQPVPTTHNETPGKLHVPNMKVNTCLRIFMASF